VCGSATAAQIQPFTTVLQLLNVLGMIVRQCVRDMIVRERHDSATVRERHDSATVRDNATVCECAGHDSATVRESHFSFNFAVSNQHFQDGFSPVWLQGQACAGTHSHKPACPQ